LEWDPQDRDSIQSSLRYLTHGVYVLATRRGRETSGMTAAWVTQVSEKPPCLAISVREDRYTHDHILQSTTFALSVLREDQVNVATHFGDASGEYADKFLGVPYGLTPSGSPHLLDCLAYLVASPKLLEIRCRSVAEMRLVNALCRFVEVAKEGG